MNLFIQNFSEDINKNGRLCPGEYDFGKLIDVLNERPRFNEVVVLVNKIRAFISKRAVSNLFTHHYFIHSNSFNDGLAAAVALYYAIAEKYDYDIGNYIVNRADMRNMIGNEDIESIFSDEQYTDDDASIYIFNQTSPYIISDFDRNGIKIVFVIYSDDIPEPQTSLVVGGNETAVNKLSDARQIAAELHYTYINIPADIDKQLAKYISDFFELSGFDISNVKKQIKRLAELDLIKDEHSAIAAARNVLNRHISYLNELPKLIASDFTEYIGKEAFAARTSSVRSIGKNRLIGLDREIKELNSAVNGLILNIKREKAGMSNVAMGCNLVFAGSPGTAKTTLARMFAKTLAANRLIPSEKNFKECKKSDIIGKYVGHTASMIDGMFSEMHQKGGGVIFFDEIYSLSEQDSTCYDKEAINCITQNIENYRSTVYCIFAGYKNKMKYFINANPGLSSRISATILFDDYSSKTLCEIFDSIVSSEEFVISGDHSKYIGQFFDQLREVRGESFGNGREARNLFEGAKRVMASRVISANETSKKALSTIKAEEVKAAADNILASVIEHGEQHMHTIGF